MFHRVEGCKLLFLKTNCPMSNAVAKKFRIGANMTLLTIDAPPDFKKSIDPLPAGVKISQLAKSFDQVHWFVKTKANMEKGTKKVLAMVKGEVICWIYYPKGSSGMQTDLNRDKGWEELLKHDMQWINLISFNETWSAFGMRQKTEADRQKESKPKERAVFDYVDPKSKTVKLPGDLAAAFKKAKTEKEFFETLSFSNKKEYIEWIVSAKRQETRNYRVKESVARLEKKWKNPSNR
jgi:hypothetical protein